MPIPESASDIRKDTVKVMRRVYLCELAVRDLWPYRRATDVPMSLMLMEGMAKQEEHMVLLCVDV